MVLKHPDPEKLFFIQADASDVAVSSTTSGKPGRRLQPCAYTSKKLTETKQHWGGWMGLGEESLWRAVGPLHLEAFSRREQDPFPNMN